MFFVVFIDLKRINFKALENILRGIRGRKT